MGAMSLIVGSTILALILVYCIGELTIIAYETFMWWGILFAIISNHHIWFNRQAVQDLNMSGSSLWLQLACFTGAIIHCSCAYAGQLRALKDRCCWRSPRQSRPHSILEVDHDISARALLESSESSGSHRNEMSRTSDDSDS